MSADDIVIGPSESEREAAVLHEQLAQLHAAGVEMRKAQLDRDGLESSIPDVWHNAMERRDQSIDDFDRELQAAGKLLKGET